MHHSPAATRAQALASLALAGQAAGAPPLISTSGGGRSLAAGVPAQTAAPARPATIASSAREVVLFEAASLKEAFARLATAFAKENAGVKVVTNAAGSQELRAQIEQGAAADVFASADRKHMTRSWPRAWSRPPPSSPATSWWWSCDRPWRRS